MTHDRGFGAEFLAREEVVALHGAITYRWGGVEIFDGSFEDFIRTLPIRTG